MKVNKYKIIMEKGTQNTPENKAAFFAQYWGQKRRTSPIMESLVPGGRGAVNGNVLMFMDNDCWLELKPLSQITDDDAVQVAMMNGGDSTTFGYRCLSPLGVTHFKGGQSIEIKINPVPTTIDFLRSKGYLLPWRDLSVEEILEYGWAKEAN